MAFAAIHLLGGAGAVGIKRRIEEADRISREAASSSSGLASSSSGPDHRALPAEPQQFRSKSIKVRIEADDASKVLGDENKRPTKYFLRLKLEWAKGKMPSKDVQAHAIDAVKGCTQGGDRFAVMGSWGAKPREYGKIPCERPRDARGRSRIWLV